MERFSTHIPGKRIQGVPSSESPVTQVTRPSLVGFGGKYFPHRGKCHVFLILTGAIFASLLTRIYTCQVATKSIF